MSQDSCVYFLCLLDGETECQRGFAQGRAARQPQSRGLMPVVEGCELGGTEQAWFSKPALEFPGF